MSKTTTKKSTKTKRAGAKTSRNAATVKTPAIKASQPNWRLWNIILAVLYAVQGVVILVLSGGDTVPVTTSFLANDTLASQAVGHSVQVSGTRHQVDVHLGWLVAAFLFVSAVVCLLRALWLRDEYENGLKNRQSSLRFVGYALAAGVMTTVIGFVSGVYDLASLIMLFALQVGVGLVWLVSEQQAAAAVKGRTLYWLGVALGIVPWIVFGIYAGSTLVYGNGVPTWVSAIYDSMFALFALFAVNLYLQRKKINRWADFLYGERIFLALSFVAQTALAWQLFAGTLHS